MLLIALAAAALMLLLTSTDALGATLVTPKCNDINLRTGPATTYARKTQVDTGARLTMVAKVDGGSYSAQCGGAQSGHYWYRISAINGKTVKSLYGVTYLYGAHKLFATVVSATPAPTQAVAPVPSAAPTSAPSAAPTEAPSRYAT